MKRKNMTRNALVTSILSLLLCVSMLVGTTFAWFTDEVTTGMNTIAAGNLDVELYAGDTKVDNGTTLFDDVELWEPGVVMYETLQVRNVGTLALKYQLALNFGDENNLNGHKLSEVLKIAVVEKIADGATREEVLTAAKAANPSTLANFCLEGELEPQTNADEQSFVIFWEPNENDVDNLYNANNGQVTSDGQPLHITFGIKLMATQLMYEEDSFGDDYDEDAVFLPRATVNETGAKTIRARLGLNGTPEQLTLNTSFQFQPNETLEQAQANPYRYWHADYVVTADKDVAANAIGLAGYYQAWCSMIDDDWIYLASDQVVPAGEEIRLVELLGATVNYEEICQFGNDGVGFLCGVADLTDDNANAGTTLTVQLRIYETEEPSDDNGNSHNVETGNYEVIGTYTYTFPG